jgi:carboxyl-terminal processing protease
MLGWLTLPGLSSPEPAQLKVFNQVWQTINDRFYDPNFNGVDWQAMRDRYRPQVEQAPSIEAAAEVINQMLGELHTSHTHFYTAQEPAYYQILGIFQPRIPELQTALKRFFPNGKIEYTDIGIFTARHLDQTFISAVLDGSPAASAGLRVGDRIVSVDEQPFHPIQSFAGKAGQAVTIKIQRSPDAANAGSPQPDQPDHPDQQQAIQVTPKQMDATTMFLDAQKASTQVIEQQGKKIGYVHIWSYAGDQYQQQLESDLIYGDLRDADGLVLDLRDGWGGAPITALNIYSKQRDLSITSIDRNGDRDTTNAQWTKPVVMVVNEGSRSAKEILAFGFQRYNIGPVVGSKTAGAVVGGTPFLMQDGSLLYVAVVDVYLNGDQRLEGKGVTPDVVVPFSLEYAQGADPQKDKAIDVVLQAIAQQG